MNKPKTDPLIGQMKKTYRKTKTAQLDRLLAEQTRWLRKETIARNKLLRIKRELIHMLAVACAEQDTAPRKEDAQAQSARGQLQTSRTIHLCPLTAE